MVGVCFSAFHSSISRQQFSPVKNIVAAARAAYDKIATLEQMALASNYNTLVTAEQRIAALEPVEEENAPVETESGSSVLWIVAIFLVAFVGFIVIRNRKEKDKE